MTIGSQKNFALLGAAGYIAPRHLKAITETGNRVQVACDPAESVGLLDRFSFDIRYFREFERFDRHVEKLRRGREADRIDYVSICTPNYLHDAHMRFALRVGAHAICEKPLVINPWNLDPVAELEDEFGKKVYTVLQLRLHPALKALKQRLAADGRRKHEVVLTYITARGSWYLNTWKGDPSRSGGIATNIGIHFFDLLIWLFGSVQGVEVSVANPHKIGGYLELERAQVRWFLSIDRKDLPFEAQPGSQTTHRSITIDGEEVEFSGGFADLHTEVYRDILAGGGFGIDDARAAISLTHTIRNSTPSGVSSRSHELVRGAY